MPSRILKLFSMLPCLRNKETDDTESSYYKNLSKLLKNLIASCDGESPLIHCYSAEELIRATNNFNPSCIVKQDSYFKVFRGFLGDRSIIITKYLIGSWPNEDETRSMAIREIVISIQMSNHKNVLKLLGCCLEFPIPVLVFEYPAKGVFCNDGRLSGTDDDQFFLPWKARLHIAKQLASVVTHLHTAFPRPIIHRDLKPSCIFLDDDYVPKLFNFSFSITLPPDEWYVEDTLKGTLGFLDPACFPSNQISEKTDVYSFGVLLLVFLTGQSPSDIGNQQGISLVEHARSHASEYQFQSIVDPKIYEDLQVREYQQLHNFLALALSCTQDEIEGRPYMTDVARELIRIGESILLS